MFPRLHNPGRFWFSPLLAALLVILQTGAVLHALGHVSDAERPDSTLPPHVACALCAAYAGADGALLGAVPPPLLDVAPASAPTETRLPASLPSLALPYQVRAPPLVAVV